jgi:biotin carboxylase
MKNKVLLVLGMTYNQIPLIKKGKELSYKVIAIGKGGGICQKYADEWYPIDTSDLEEVYHLAKRKGITAMITAGTSTANCTISYVNEKLKLSDKVNKYNVSLNSTYKNRFRELIPHLLPKGFEFTSIKELREACVQMQFPLISKPSDGGGGKGITVCDTIDEIENAFNYALNYSQNNSIIVEEFIEGYIIGVESFTLNGITTVLTITDKIISSKPRCITLGLTVPSKLDTLINQKVIEINQEAIKKLDILWGPTHIDMAIDHFGHPYIIDIGPRLAGGPVFSELLPKMYNYDFLKAAIQLSEGIMPLPIPKLHNHIYYSERFIIANQQGILKEIIFPSEDVLNEYSIMSYRILKDLGSNIGSNCNDGDRILMYTSFDKSYETLNSKLDKFEQKIKIVIENK